MNDGHSFLMYIVFNVCVNMLCNDNVHLFPLASSHDTHHSFSTKCTQQRKKFLCVSVVVVPVSHENPLLQTRISDWQKLMIRRVSGVLVVRSTWWNQEQKLGKHSKSTWSHVQPWISGKSKNLAWPLLYHVITWLSEVTPNKAVAVCGSMWHSFLKAVLVIIILISCVIARHC